MSQGLSKGEWEQFVDLLQRFAEYDLDQHDAWRLDTRYGPVFVRVSRKRGPDEPAEAFRLVATPKVTSRDDRLRRSRGHEIRPRRNGSDRAGEPSP